MLYNSATMINVKSSPYNATGNGTTDDSAAINAAYTAAVAAGKDLYFPAGTYFTVGGVSPGIGNLQNVTLYGDKPSTSIIKQTSIAENNISSAQDLGFLDTFLTDYGVQLNCSFINCNFTVTIGTGSSYYTIRGFYVYGQNVIFDGCTFNFNLLYSAIWCEKCNSVLIQNCTFIGPATHVIRMNSANSKESAKRITIKNNNISSTGTLSVTGIFIAGNRNYPWTVNITGNTVIGVTEEAIAFDGFGNNSSLCPTICNGVLGSLSNDSNGRLVIGMANMLYYGSAPNQSITVSALSTWTNFNFSMGPGTNYEGSTFGIYSYDSGANTITLDSKILASSVGSSGYGAVQVGFFNCVVRDNYVSNAGLVGISLYLNAFNCIVDNNTIVNCGNGINLAGGLELSTYNLCAYNNIISNNKVFGCNFNGTIPANADNTAVGFISYYGGQYQYNNKFTNNTVIGGNIYMQKQKSLVFNDNSLNTLSMLVTNNA